MSSRHLLGFSLLGLLFCCGLIAPMGSAHAVSIDNVPLFLGGHGTPLTLLVMGRDHKLYYEAYNDASDLNGDNVVDVGYKPSMVDFTKSDQPILDYYGYFDSHKCYSYDTSANRFKPVSVTANKRCTNLWSGDFLNYLTTSRMDALRRVLYGGYRSSDPTSPSSSNPTILERSYIPQDAHSWGKEYGIDADGTNRNGYNISDYAPLSDPPAGKRHLFANTTLLCPVPSGYAADSGCDTNVGLPLLRVLINSDYRVWEWLSIERPVAGSECVKGTNGSRGSCATAGGTVWEIVPTTQFKNLVQTTYNFNNSPTITPSHPSNHTDFNTILYKVGASKSDGTPDTDLTNDKGRFGYGSATQINGTGNPFSTQQDNYITVFRGILTIPTTGSYTFAVDGDDAVEVMIDGTAASNVVAYWYGGHGKSGNNDSSLTSHSGSVTLTAGDHTIEFRHEENSGDDSYYLYWKRTIPASTMTNYVVRVEACVSGMLESECQAYSPSSTSPVSKPIGLLQKYGENDQMAFGLLTGSYRDNLSGGVLRKNISSLTNEIDSNNGTLNSSITGVIGTINKLKIYGYGSSYYHYLDCGVPEVGPMKQGRCRMWGNPIAEMMYEGLRYFAGKTAGTAVFTNGVSDSGSDDTALGLPLPTWQNPYRSDGGYPRCSKPFELVISDINPSFDTDQLPSSYFLTDRVSSSTSDNNPTDKDSGHSMSASFDLTDLDVTARANTIWQGESANEGTNIFIGQSDGVYDGAPTPKTVNNFNNIRGLTPEEPTRQGGLYAASVAFYGHTRDNGFGPGKEKVDTFSVALASPLPQIRIPITSTTGTTATTQWITLVPFGKSVGGSGVSATQGQFQPTNTIVDFYVDTLKNTGTANYDASVNGGRAYGKFRINFEDSEYGSDHDMDAIVLYEFTVKSDNTLDVALSSDYAAGGVIQHMGYVISGSNHDGVYLEVRDVDTGASSDIHYFLDTPEGCYAYDANSSVSASGLACRMTNASPALPTTHTRNFSAGSGSAVFLKHDPLWYAAKWGGFVEDQKTANQLPTLTSPPTGSTDCDLNKEWDADCNGVPDNYFLVTNASRLKEQLSQAFQQIIAHSGSAAAVAINSGYFQLGTSRIYQAKFHSEDWSGHLLSYDLNADGSLKQKEWDAVTLLNNQNFNTGRVILTYKASTSTGVAFRWPTSVTDSAPTSTPSSTEIDLAQANLLKGSSVPSTGKARLEFLRGDKSNEGTGLQFRVRKETYEVDEGGPGDVTGHRYDFVLGDIINSNPVYVAAPEMRFDLLLTAASAATERTAYATFRANNSSRAPMVYVGANDGMLHGFDAATGAEKIAYVPNLIYDNLAMLSDVTYPSNHRYFVDGSAKVGDVYYGTDATHPENNWHTLLVGSLRKGGKGLFALDITSPTSSNFAESNAASLVRWEFTDATNLGYSFSQPSLARLQNNLWAAVFGNGYNSTNGHAALFLIDARTGGNASATPAGFKKVIDTNPTSDASLGSATTPNGLSTPVMVDYDGDGVVDYAYAGDLFGNLWRFNLTNSNPTSWSVQRIFIAKDGTGTTAKTQPITGKPQIVRHPNGGLLVLFGTGLYLSSTDVTNTDKQTFYAIWDQDPSTNPPSSLPTRTDLQEQTISTVTVTDADSTTTTYRVSSDTQVCWKGDTTICKDSSNNPITGTKLGWFMDLPGLSATPTPPSERVVSDPILVGENVVFTSIAPSTDPCEYGGTSWLNVMDSTTGRRLSETFVTLSGSDTAITATPVKVGVGGAEVAPTSIQYSAITSAPTRMNASYAINIYTTSSEGKVIVSHLSSTGVTGRLSWRQLEFVQ